MLDPSELFYEDILLEVYKKIQGLSEVILKNLDREITEEKIVHHYIEVLFNLLNSFDKLWLKSDYLAKMGEVVKNLMNLNKHSFNNIPTLAIKTLGDILQIPIIRKQLHKDYEFGDTLPFEKQFTTKEVEDRVNALTKEREAFKELKVKKLNNMLDGLLMVKNESDIRSSKMTSVEILTVNSISMHFLNDPQVLTKTTNFFTGYLEGEDSNNRKLAIIKLSNILKFRRKEIIKPVYIYKKDYTSTSEGCKVSVDAEVLKAKGVDENKPIFVDRAGFAWTNPPPYIKVYKNVVAELPKDDTLIKELNNPKTVSAILKKSILDHEVAKEKQLMEEGKESGPSLRKMLSQVIKRDIKRAFAALIPAQNIINRSYVDMSRIRFYQSCFELYGCSCIKSFSTPIDILIAHKKEEVTLMCILEVVCGYLRASKVFTPTMNDYCFEKILRIIKEAPVELLPDINKALTYFLKKRDPKRWISLWNKLFTGLLPNSSSGTLENNKFFTVMHTMLNAWLCRGDKLIDEYMKWYMNNVIQETEKISELAAKNLSLILYHVANASQLTDYQPQLESILRAECNAKTRNAKISLLYILRGAATSEAKSVRSHSWLIKLLTPLCYQLIVNIKLKNRLTKRLL